MCHLANRVFCAVGGLLGATGIAAYVAATHIGNDYYAELAPILLGNAPILVILGFSKIRCIIAWIGGLLISLGAILFALDLPIIQTKGFHLFSYAAPLGGIMIILGWLVFTIMAFLPAGENYQ